MGDVVVTRQNNRQLMTGRAWVKNGDEWVVTATGIDGAVTVRRRTGRPGFPGGQVVLPRDYVAEHVELGYATTVHRAQGRTADTAHAFVNSTTHREGLYVAATRGRESNHLYVDTLYDPDSETAHGLPPMVPAGDVLRGVLANRGAEVSATEAMKADWREHRGIVQVLAEYNTLAAVALRERYDELITRRSGLSDDEVARVQESASYGGLLVALREAEDRGLDVDASFSSLVAARPLDDADDVAAVLHERVDHWASAARQAQEPRRINGLFPKAPAVGDPDLTLALRDREQFLEQRASALTRAALDQGEAWIIQLGVPPADLNSRARWTRCAETVAAYRERWGIAGGHVLGAFDATSLEQEEQRRLARRAVDQAIQIDNRDQQTVGAAVQIEERNATREGIER